MKIELEGHIYLVKNEYDQYEVEELGFDKDMTHISYKDADWNSFKHHEWRHAGGWGKEEPKVKIESGTGLVDILKEKLNLEACELEYKKIGPNVGEEVYTFMPKTKKVRITIEEID